VNQPLINEALKIVRLYWGKTQAELAETLDVSQSYISEIEKGKREVTMDLLGRYSRELNVPMSSLMLFAEKVEGAPPIGRGRLFLAGKTLQFLKRLIPDDIKSAN
jgi:transcriptional regulator with XRE-family HTH domain